MENRTITPSSSSSLFSGGEALKLSITPARSLISKERIASAKPGVIGRGFNILDGSTKPSPYEILHIDFAELIHNSTPNTIEENLLFYKNFYDFEKECATRVGIKYEDGYFSLGTDDNLSDAQPFLTNVDKAAHLQHFIAEFRQQMYHLKVAATDLSEVPEKFKQKPLVKYVCETPFGADSKSNYYAFFDTYGTHFITEVVMGGRAEFRWSLEQPEEKDALQKVTTTQVYRRLFADAVRTWKESGFGVTSSSKEQLKMPKATFERKRVTGTFLDSSVTELGSHHLNAAGIVSFKVKPIYEIFPEKTRYEMELALTVYLEEMRPFRDTEEIPDNCLLAIYCTTNGKWIRVNDHGNLYADTAYFDAAKIFGDGTGSFEVKKKGRRFGLKSAAYGKRFVSRALMSTTFHFHRMQFLGPHESFEISGNMLLACGSFGSPDHLYLDVGSEVRHDSSPLKRSHFVLLNPEPRMLENKGGKFIEKEPSFVEDQTVQVEVKSKSEREAEEDALLLEKLSLGSKSKFAHTPKSNSTSSLFIKDTILLPNINELTKGMAFKIRDMIEKARLEPNPKFFEEFSEEKFPLTYHVPKKFDQVPSVETIFHFLNTIFRVEKLKPEPGIMCMLYLGRMLNKSGITIHASNWRRVVISCLILATKVWEDAAVWNVDFMEFFPATNVKDLNRLEKWLLKYLEFNVSIKASDYVKTYFELREYINVESSRDLNARPLDQQDLARLEVRSASSEKKMMKSIRTNISMSFHPGAKPGQDGSSSGFGILS